MLALLSATLAAVSLHAAAAANTCTTHGASTMYNNTDYADGSGPRDAANASDCCAQCTNAHN